MTPVLRGFVSLFVAIGLVVCLWTPGLAQIPPPQTVEILEVQAFRHLVQANDTLYVIRYNIDWGNITQPVVAVDNTFDFILYDDAGVVVGNKTAPVFHNSGYNQGIVSFYFPGNTTNPSWGELGNVTVEGTAFFAAPPPSGNYTITADDYTTFTSPADIREDLRQFIVAQSMFIDYDWNDWWFAGGAQDRQANLLSYLQDYHSYVLSATGEAYYSFAIPDLETYCPILFLFTLSEIPYTQKDHSQAGKSAYEGQWEGTPVEDFRLAVADLMGGVGASTAFTILVVILVLANMAWTSVKYNRLYPGIMSSWGTVLILARMGLPDIAMVMLVATAAMLFALYGLLLRPGQG